MPKPGIESSSALPLTALCEFCGDDILKLTVNRATPTSDVRVGVAISGLLEHLFTCRMIRAAQEAKGQGVYLALCDPDEYDDDDPDDPDDDPDDDEYDDDEYDDQYH